MNRLTRVDAGGCITGAKKEQGAYYGIDEMLLKLKNYEDAEEQGLLLRLPCKVGDTVWVNGKDGIVECTLDNTFRYSAKHLNLEIMRYMDGTYKGKQSVFLTREAAEEALKGGATE